MILSKKELRGKDYICIILNRAAIDFLHCMLLAGLQPVGILTETDLWCEVIAFLEAATAIASIFFEPLLACNRYISMFHSPLYKEIFTIRNVAFMSIALLIFATLLTIPHIFIGDLGRTTGFFCVVKLTKDSVLVTVIANILPVSLGTGAVGFFNYKIYQFLSRHQSQRMTNSQRSILQRDREMLKFIMVSAFSPMIMQAPVIAATWTHMFIPLPPWLLFCSVILILSMYVLNPLLALFMVKPLKSRLMSMVGSITGKNSVVPLAVGSHGPANGSSDGVAHRNAHGSGGL